MLLSGGNCCENASRGAIKKSACAQKRCAEIVPNLKALLVRTVMDLEQDANTRIARKPINGHEFLRLLEVLQSCAQAPLPIARPGYTRPVPSPELPSVELSTRTRSASVV